MPRGRAAAGLERSNDPPAPGAGVFRTYTRSASTFPKSVFAVKKVLGVRVVSKFSVILGPRGGLEINLAHTNPTQ